MRILSVITILILIVTGLSCDNDGIATDTFEVTTAGIGIDCHLVLIDFKDSDLDRIKAITNSDWSRYQAYNLDKVQFGQAGKVLTVRVRKTLDSETFPCTTQGPGYPWVTVLGATELR